MKVTRPMIQKQEDERLAPYAVRSSESRGRQYPEKEHDMRTAFQRDRDRIIHCTAFRRLEYKTQVFVNHEGDHYRTRLTHTLETCQISRSVARALGLNEDLTEAIALAHDMGHGPFGHAGEWALEELMKEHGGFEHNVHTLRIVEKLEESYVEFPGLNLTFETREGLKKHPEHFYRDRSKHFRSLEAEVVDQCDEIAYCSHDLDDGLRSEFIHEEEVKDLRLWHDAAAYIIKKYPEIAPVQKKRLVIRLIINRLAMDLTETTEARIKKMKIKDLKALQKTGLQVVGLSDPVKKQLVELKRFLYKNLYQHYRVIRMTDKGQRFLKSLFGVYMRKPQALPPDVVRRSVKEGLLRRNPRGSASVPESSDSGLPRAICDYLAGMTDRFALDEYKRIFEPYERV